MKIHTDLRTAVRGRVLLPGDDGFEAATRPWNLAVDQPVPAFVEAADADDIAATVRCAARAGVPVTAQPSGHGAAPAVAGAILLRTARLDELHIDPAARTARVGAGVAWERVQAEAARHGLTGLPGSSPVVTVAGYTLGGGLSWFGRAYGWAADDVTAFDVVTAEGVRARVTAATDPDLFWALRGGGGDFALVTALEFALHPAPELYGGRRLWPARKASEVLDAFRRITTGAPRELTVWADLLNFPGAPPMVAIDATYLGAAAKARELLAPLDAIGDAISDTRGPLPLAELGSITAEPTTPGPGASRAELLTHLDDFAVKTLLAEPIDPLLSVQLRHVGGALSDPSDSPHGPQPEPYALYLFGVPDTDGTAVSIRTRQQDLVTALGSRVAGRKPFTFLAPGETPADAFTPASLARLRELKRDRDPQGVIRSNYPVLG
ncbi:FAD-binding oxidoreductase [Streptomyces sp. A7024]|uniref:FAD-binding oxidoreductase n=1 Tax=Streptomyces coryli TaxID=1128680 RepID=A0A6G4U6V6_9ACTN|nr:FAD-binding oxidoreductase [Streptomyces coryli]NGN67975.1 FAD-binding oxidoreductase [Streptomyces coryli]